MISPKSAIRAIQKQIEQHEVKNPAFAQNVVDALTAIDEWLKDIEGRLPPRTTINTAGIPPSAGGAFSSSTVKGDVPKPS